MTIPQAIELLKDRAAINRAMCPEVKSDFDKFCNDEADAVDVVLKELEKRK